jgi:hypothetical protein
MSSTDTALTNLDTTLSQHAEEFIFVTTYDSISDSWSVGVDIAVRLYEHSLDLETVPYGYGDTLEDAVARFIQFIEAAAARAAKVPNV